MAPTSMVVLPSIHEMFPEHLLDANYGSTQNNSPFAHGRNHLTVPLPAPTALPLHFFDARFHPGMHQTASYSSSIPYPAPWPPTTNQSPAADVDEDEETELASDGMTNDDDDADGDYQPGSHVGSSTNKSTRNHVCSQCGKRFNRPSSVRIHANMHTGATPYRCPYPNCGRAFNVNSNMRRHFRNHSAALSAAASAGGVRSTFSSRSSTDAATLHSSSNQSLRHARTRAMARVRDAVAPAPASYPSSESSSASESATRFIFHPQSVPVNPYSENRPQPRPRRPRMPPPPVSYPYDDSSASAHHLSLRPAMLAPASWDLEPIVRGYKESAVRGR
ncbi:hypothetical protein C8F01DRAFT_1134795 [Mycena amicta]|nr:hypothetical protein C8F01DRAFT_1134795 [Mycena amicta]